MLQTSTSVLIPKSNRAAPPVQFFTGRDSELEAVVRHLQGGKAGPAAKKRCILRGRSGTGKTELCLAAAHHLRQEYPDAQIYLHVEDHPDSDISLYRILETIVHIQDPLARIPDDPDLLHTDYLSILNGKKALIILDDLPSGLNLARLLPPSSCALLMAAGEEEGEYPDVHSITLAALSQENSRNLLVSLCPRTQDLAGTLSSLCQHLPVNLCLAAGYLSRYEEIKVEDFISGLEDYFERSSERTTTHKLLAHLAERLSPKERMLLSSLGVLSDGFSEEMVLELTDQQALDDPATRASIRACLDAFTSLNLVNRDGEQGYYRMLPDVREFALKRLGDIPQVWHRLARVLTATLGSHAALTTCGADRYLLDVQVFDDHKRTVHSVLHYLVNHPSAARDQLLLEFSDLVRFFGSARFAPGIELAAWLEAMLDASVRLNDRDRLDAILALLAKTHQELGNEEKALGYSRLQEQVRRNGTGESREHVLAGIRAGGSTTPWEFDPQSKMPPALEKLSTHRTKIILTGFMGTGKTTVGKLLADYLDYGFIDTDELIENRNGRSISEIFQDLGEEAFREMERAVVREIAGMDGVVISTGGRLMLDPENVNALSDNSRVLCLVATPDEILNRVADDQEHKRPLLSVPNPKERIVELLQERDDKYRRFPQVTTDEKQPTDIARGLVEFINTSPRSLTVENPQKSYEYVVGAGLLPFIRQLTGLDGQAVIITDEIVRAQYGPSCASTGQIIEIPSGQRNKSLATVQAVYDRLIELGFDRSGTIISLGGSAVGDIAGFVAATYMRGVNLIQCPTSLIAMVDTSVGGKTSIDLPQGKNMIGVYKQPAKVIADVATLQTLHQGDFASGMAEVVKHGLIAESNLLEQVEQGYWAKNWDRSPSYIGELQRLVAQAIQVKINIVQSDPFERGQRSILNLGHTFAYAIEQVSQGAYRHGEAVSMGLVAAAQLSAQLGFCDASLQKRIETILVSVHLPIRIPPPITPDALLQAMQHDKKKRAGHLRFILLRGIGQAFVSDEVPNDEILAALSALAD